MHTTVTGLPREEAGPAARTPLVYAGLDCELTQRIVIRLSFA